MRAILLLASLAAALAAAFTAAPAWGPKAVGVLLVGEGGGAEWTKTVAEAKKNYAGMYPVEALAGNVGVRELQIAIDRLQAARAKRIVVVPLRLYSQAADIDQLQYLLGMREYPSEAFMGAGGYMSKSQIVRRAKIKVPAAMTTALDDDPLVAAVLTARARELSREPLKEGVVLVGVGEAEGTQAQSRLDSLAKQVAHGGRFLSGQGVAIKPEPSLRERDKAQNSWRRDLSRRGTLVESRKGSDQDLREVVMNAGRSGRALVVPYLLAPDGTERLIRRKLEGLFFQWKGKCILYDEHILQWIKKKVDEGAKSPNMVKYKDEGKAPSPPDRKKFVP